MTLDQMISDFCHRALTDYTPEVIKTMIHDNYSIITDDGFIVFNFVLMECHCFFCYVVPGRENVFRDFVTAVEILAKQHGCKKTKFITKRDKAFARYMKDYKPCAIMFEKELG